MTPEKWKDISGSIKDKFDVSDEGRTHIDEDGGADIDYIEFSSPLGKMRLEFIVKPVILDKKTTYSRRIGSETKVDYVYSDIEKQYILQAYKWDEAQDDWEEVDGEAFA